MKLNNSLVLGKIVPILSHFSHNNEKVIILSHKNLLFVLNSLKLHINYQYKLLSCISGIDFLNLKYRFGVVYDLLSLTYNSRIRVKVFVNEITSVNSIVEIYKNAD